MDAVGASDVLERFSRSLAEDHGCLSVRAGAVTRVSPPPVADMLRVADEAMYEVQGHGGGAGKVIDADGCVSTEATSGACRRHPSAR